MLSFDQFRTSQFCKPLILADEDTPQDAKEGHRLIREHQQRQYQAYVAQHEPKEQEQTSEEKRVTDRLTMLRNNHTPVTQHVSQQSNNSKKSRAEWFRDYRDRTRNCPHCGKEIRHKREK